MQRHVTEESIVYYAAPHISGRITRPYELNPVSSDPGAVTASPEPALLR